MKVASYLLLILGLVCSETSSSQNQNSATGSGQRIVVIDSGISRDEAESQKRSWTPITNKDNSARVLSFYRGCP